LVTRDDLDRLWNAGQHDAWARARAEMDAEEKWAARIRAPPTIPPRQRRSALATFAKGLLPILREQLAQRDARIKALEARLADFEQRLTESESKRTTLLRSVGS
jgi:hypothetical protein